MDWITGAELLLFAKVKTPTPQQELDAADDVAAINAAIDRYLDWPAERVTAGPTTAESAEVKGAAKLAASQLWARRGAPFGVTGYADADGAAIRVAADPIAGVKPMLDRHRQGAGGSFG